MPLCYSSIARKTQRYGVRLMLLSLLAALSLAACAPADTPATVAAPAPVASMNQANESQRLTEWLDAEYAHELDFSPLAKTRLGDKTPMANSTMFPKLLAMRSLSGAETRLRVFAASLITYS